MRFIYKGLFFFLLVFMPLAHGTVEVWSVTVFHVVSVLIAALWMISMVKDGHIRFYRTPLDLPVLMFVSLAFISVFYSVYPYASRIELYKIINYVFIFYFVVNTVSDKKKFLVLAWFIALLGGAYAVAGLVIVEGNFLGFKIFSFAHNWITLTFVNHNHFAGYMEMVAMLCVGLALGYKGSRRILVLCLSTLASSAVFLSLSRGGIIGLLCGLFFFCTIFAFCKGKRRNIWLLVSFIVLIIVVIASLGGLEAVLQRMETIREPVIAGKGRLEIWKGAFSMISDNLWFGTGIGTFQYSYPRYQTGMADLYINHAHNDYLEITAEMGVIGILAALFIIIVLFYYCLKKLTVLSDKSLQAIGIASLSGCFALLIHGVTDFNFHIPSNATLFVVCAAIAFVVSDSDNRSKISKSIIIRLSNRRRLAGYFVVLLITIVALPVVVSPYLGNYFIKKAKVYQKSNNYELASAYIEKAIFIDPGNAEHFAAMGDIMIKRSVVSMNLAQKKQFLSNSLEYYDKAIKECPVRSYYYTKKALSLKRLGYFQEAEKAFNRASDISPADTYTHYDLGKFYLRQGELIKAYAEYRKFLQLGQPDNRNLFMVLDELWKVTQNYNDLKQSVPEIAVIKNYFAAYMFRKGEQYSKLGKHKEAISIYNGLIEENKKNTESYIRLASIYCEAKRYKEAISTLETGLKYNPDNSSLYSNLGICYSQMGKTERALEFHKKAVVMDPGKDFYHDRLGEEYRRSGNYRKAIAQWKKCLQINPNLISCKNSLKKMYELFGVF